MTEKSFGAAELGQQLMVNYHKRVWECHKLAKHNQSRIKHRNLIKTKKNGAAGGGGSVRKMLVAQA